MQNLNFKLHRSWQMISLILVIFLASIGVIISLPALALEKYLAIFIIMSYGSYLIWRYGLLNHSDSILQIECGSEGEWRIQTQDNLYQAKLNRDCIVTSLILLMRFHVSGKFFPLTTIILRNSLKEDDYRRLVLAIKFSPSEL